MIGKFSTAIPVQTYLALCTCVCVCVCKCDACVIVAVLSFAVCCDRPALVTGSIDWSGVWAVRPAPIGENDNESAESAM